MKYTIIAALLLLTSCQNKQAGAPNITTEFSQLGEQFKVVVIDSCEYVVACTDMRDGGMSIIHKQNCKFCNKRK